MLTYEAQIAAAQQSMNEPGTEPPCPFCQRPRVLRSDYIRCNPCGINWLAEEMHLDNYLNMDPRVARARMGSSTKPIVEPPAEGAND